MSYLGQNPNTAIDANKELSNLLPAGQTQVCTAWVNFDGTGVIAIRDSFNISSITDRGIGNYGANFSSSVANTAFVMAGSTGTPAVSSGIVNVSALTAQSTTSAAFVTVDGSNAVFDFTNVFIIVFGGL